MSGNVSEWCADLYGSYAASPQTNPAGASSGNRRVVRGGDWLHNARLARNTARNSQPPTFRSPQLGFRLAQ